MGFGVEGWVLFLVLMILGFLVMVLYGYWDKIMGKEYYVDVDILVYDEDFIEELKKEGKV